MSLTDSYHRIHNYLRISLTDHCNFRCKYCMPDESYPFLSGPALMQPNEIIQIASVFVKRGVRKIRLTGGEPLVRKEAAEIILQLAQLPVELTLTTNGVLLPNYFSVLREANVKSVNISLDTLDPHKFMMITRRDAFSSVWNAIEKSIEAGLRVKINMVVMKGINDDEIIPFIELTQKMPVEIRFIEFMPFTGNQWENNKLVTYQEILDIIRQKYPVDKKSDQYHDTAKHYSFVSQTGNFAVISTMTHPFCQTCNRLRLTADGKMKNCLFSKGETDLLTALRNGKDIEPMIWENLKNKAERLGGQFMAEPQQVDVHKIDNRSMIAIGG